MRARDTGEALLLPLVEEIYGAALDPSRWSAVVRRLERHWSGKASLLAQDTRNLSASVAERGSFSETEEMRYRGHYVAVNPWLAAISRLPAGEVVLDNQLVPTEAFERGEFYNDWLRPQGLYYSIGGVILKEEGVSTNLTVLRAREAGPYGEDDVRFLRALLPHLRRALQIHGRLCTADVLLHGSEQALDRLGLGVIITDAMCRVAYANPAAERTLRANNALLVSGGRLRGRTPSETSALEREVARAVGLAAGKGASAGIPLPLSRQDKGPLSAVVVPLHPRVPCLGGVPRALIFVSDPEDALAPDPEQVRRFYGLTAAEARLLLALLQGRGLTDYARDAGMSVNTAKAHLKHVFMKVGAERQSDLVRQVLSNPTVHLRGGAE